MKCFKCPGTRPVIFELVVIVLLLAAPRVFADNSNGNGALLLLSGADAWSGVVSSNSSDAQLVASGTADQGGWHANGSDALLRINPLVMTATEGEGEGLLEGEGTFEGQMEGLEEGQVEGEVEGIPVEGDEEGIAEGAEEGSTEEGLSEGIVEGEMDDGLHTADQDGDNQISLSELLRIIQFFNSNGFHCETGTEDGYAPGLGDQTCTPHDSDYNAQDWLINLSELLRIIQFFNSGGYHACEGSEDGFCPGLS